VGRGRHLHPARGRQLPRLSTGDLGQLADDPADEGDVAYHCNSWFPGGDGMDTTKFPRADHKHPVDGDCLDDPALVGTGDCSHSIEPQFDQSGFKYDYQEVRLTATVPPGAVSLSFDFAFLTKEYPIWKDRPYNDMFIGWLEASNWTGNIAFDRTATRSRSTPPSSSSTTTTATSPNSPAPACATAPAPAG
jgi:hypothetical protein